MKQEDQRLPVCMQPCLEGKSIRKKSLSLLLAQKSGAVILPKSKRPVVRTEKSVTLCKAIDQSVGEENVKFGAKQLRKDYSNSTVTMSKSVNHLLQSRKPGKRHPRRTYCGQSKSQKWPLLAMPATGPTFGWIKLKNNL